MKMSFKVLISLLFISSIDWTKSSPNLCSEEESKPLKSFTTITQMVNDSYLVTNTVEDTTEDMFSVFENPNRANFTNKTSDIIPKGSESETFGGHGFKFDIIFPIDIDGYCVNVEEKLFAISFTTDNEDNKYSYYTKKEWNSISKMVDSQNIGLEALNKINHRTNANINKGEKKQFKAILFFHSFGLLLIKRDTSYLAYCSNNGWQLESEYAIELRPKINFTDIDSGFVDNDKQLVYLFEVQHISGHNERIRKYFYNCSYTLKTSAVSLNCEKKSMNELCVTEKPSQKPTEETKKFLNGEVIGLIVLVVFIGIVLILILYLLCCCGAPKLRKESQTTLASDGGSHPVVPESSASNKK